MGREPAAGCRNAVVCRGTGVLSGHRFHRHQTARHRRDSATSQAFANAPHGPECCISAAFSKTLLRHRSTQFIDAFEILAHITTLAMLQQQLELRVRQHIAPRAS